ncbi:primosomal protein N' [Algiphilus sp.]|uniref:primosomal protein N' n=1 Tax=Algiphilus sp. TaxID=1872431 RepID=UPI0025BB465B|nr:primosomal protein N' [Algiphilus sp.]
MWLIATAVKCPLRRRFDYQVPEALVATLSPGMRIRVPFGRRETIAVTLDAPRRVDDGGTARAYRPLGEVLDDAPLLDTELLASLKWAADYYHHPIGEVVAAALPTALRQGEARNAAEQPWLHITAAGRAVIDTIARRAPAQARLLARLAEGAMPRSEAPREQAKALLERGYCEQALPAPLATPPPPEPGAPVALTAEQTAALAGLPWAGFGVTVLQGVTGSGKTELYLRRIADDIAAGGQALLLVPEIGLTPQLLERARERLGGAVIGYHSAMTDSARLDAWRRVDAGEPLLVVGTRSAVWLPFRRLMRVCVDEEHDVSFKQQDGFRYSARDVAVVRARAFDAPVVLGSATPSLESLHNASTGRYQLVRLDVRAREAPGARLHVVDARGQRLRGGLTPDLSRALQRHVADGGQALLFVNRRGYAPALLCHDCGWGASCRACDARMTWHKRRGRLLCHHCGAQQAVPESCPACGSATLRAAGHGTERVEEHLRTLLPEARIARADSDAMQRAGAWDTLRDEVLSGAVQVLVGTQMLAKGHDFPGITLVGIVSVDQALFSADLRATERMAQLVTQVAGRAGRGARAGEVLLQTHVPDHPLLRELLDDGYEAFAASLRAERAAAALPPARPLALLRAESAAERAADAFLEAAAGVLRARGAEALGPVPAPMMRRAGRYRAQLWLQADSRAALQQALAQACVEIEALPAARRVRWGVDVDPADTL